MGAPEAKPIEELIGESAEECMDKIADLYRQDLKNSYFVRYRRPELPSYEKEYWGTVTDPDGRVRDRRNERETYLENIQQEMSFLNSLTPGTILSIGCGLGFMLSALHPGWQRYGIEISEYAASIAAQWGDIFIGELHEADYSDGQFDVVVMHHVIEHLDDPISIIIEIHRVLRPGGNLLLSTPDFNSGCARRFGSKYRLLNDSGHISLFTSDSMHRFLRDYGFEIDRVEYPFFETRYFTPENLSRLFDTSQVSPPFYGNFMSFYCHKPE